MKTLICYKNRWVATMPDKIGSGRIILGRDKKEYKTDKLRYVDNIGYVWDSVIYVKPRHAPNR